MSMLVGDIGATGSTWGLIRDADPVRYFDAPGYNPVSHGEPQLVSVVDAIEEEVGELRLSTIWYYGAGAGNSVMTRGIEKTFLSRLQASSVHIGSDLLAAGRALCQSSPGTVAILGTGSNVGEYDGLQIVSQASSLGYPLGDEGSGTDLGKRLARGFYYGLLPPEIKVSAAERLPSDRFEFLNELRSTATPNRFLAQLSRVLALHRDHPWVKQQVREAFTDFASIHLRNQKKHEKIHFVGSIAFYFCDEIRLVLEEFQLQLGEVVREPIELLVSFHQNQINNE